jgi:Uma2 family endonuclease
MRAAFPNGHRFRIQMPFHAIGGSESEPDVAVIPGSARDRLTSHPTHASVIIEVSDTTLRIDRNKASLYARSGIRDFWIVNLVDATIEVYREPQVGAAATSGSFGSIQTFKRGESLSPLAAPKAVIVVDELLP